MNFFQRINFFLIKKKKNKKKLNFICFILKNEIILEFLNET